MSEVLSQSYSLSILALYELFLKNLPLNLINILGHMK